MSALSDGASHSVAPPLKTSALTEDGRQEWVDGGHRAAAADRQLDPIGFCCDSGVDTSGARRCQAIRESASRTDWLLTLLSKTGERVRRSWTAVGRVVRTIYLLRWIISREMRQEISG